MVNTVTARAMTSCGPSACAPAMILVQCVFGSQGVNPGWHPQQILRTHLPRISDIHPSTRCCARMRPSKKLVSLQSIRCMHVERRGIGSEAGEGRSKKTSVASGNAAAGESVNVRAEELHTPVLLNEVLSVFEGRSVKTFVDGTLGMAGHSTAIYQAHRGNLQKLVGIDQDPVALEHARKRLEECGCSNVKLMRGNFGDIGELVAEAGVQKGQVDGILLDIGTSSMQLDDGTRGFSFMRDGPLDMRMDPTGSLTAADIVNTWGEEEIARVLWEFGEETKSRSIAKKIVAAREIKPITTTLELSNLLGGDKARTFNPRKRSLHPATLSFQALRIAVNRELTVLAHALPQAIELLAPGGRLAVISFHSLEDRIVKWAFREVEADEGKAHKNKYAKDEDDKLPPGSMKLVTKRPLVATEEEIKINPRSRSAKLRVIEKV